MLSQKAVNLSMHPVQAALMTLYRQMHVSMPECLLQVNGDTVKLGMPGAAQRMEASAKVMIPLQRVGTPEDAAGAMLLLASPYASYISAQVLPPFFHVHHAIARAQRSQECLIQQSDIGRQTL